MNARSWLVAELDAFAGIVDDLAAISGREDAARRRELIALRKRLSAQLATLRSVGLDAFAADPALAEAYRQRLSTVLNLVAMHQANWPAVSIDDGGGTYRQSARAVAEANRAFIGWTRAALGVGRSPPAAD